MFQTRLSAKALLIGFLGVASANLPVSAQFSVSGSGGFIPVSGTGGGGAWPNSLPPSEFVSTVAVPNAVASICSVKIDGLNHTWVGDLQIVLVDPNGIGRNLMSRPGMVSSGGLGSSGNLTGGLYEFVDPSTAGALVVPSTGDMPPGQYQQHVGEASFPWPDGTNNIFNTPMNSIVGPAGTWSLKIYDWAAVDTGSLTGWTLEGNGCGGGPPPIAYCVAKTNSLGCTPAIGALGTPSATAGSGFVVQATNHRNQKSGILFYGLTGRSALPFQGGTLCVKSPIKRTPAMSSGGTALPAADCSGVYSLDMNAFAVGGGGGNPAPQLTTPGTVVDCQFWGRDPGFPPPNATSLSDGLEYTVGP